jgi:hypothetical protein
MQIKSPPEFGGALSGGSFVLDRPDERGEYGPAGATGDCLRDDSANAQIARLRRGHDRRQHQSDDLTDYSASNQAGNDIADRAEIERRRRLACADAAKSARNEIDKKLFHVGVSIKQKIIFLD